MFLPCFDLSGPSDITPSVSKPLLRPTRPRDASVLLHLFSSNCDQIGFRKANPMDTCVPFINLNLIRHNFRCLIDCSGAFFSIFLATLYISFLTHLFYLMQNRKSASVKRKLSPFLSSPLFFLTGWWVDRYPGQSSMCLRSRQKGNICHHVTHIRCSFCQWHNEGFRIKIGTCCSHLWL